MTEYDEEFLICVYFKGKGIYMKRIKAFIVENNKKVKSIEFLLQVKISLNFLIEIFSSNFSKYCGA